MKILTSLIVFTVLGGLGWLIYTNVAGSSKLQQLNETPNQRQEIIETLE